jgi:hypothetical protein
MSRREKSMKLFIANQHLATRSRVISILRFPFLSFAVTALIVGIYTGLFCGSVRATSIPDATSSSRDHVYLFRGLLPIFSSGMIEIADQLQKHGISATVYNHTEWQQVTDKITARYKTGHLRRIVLVGYSAGAGAMTKTMAQLGARGIPVKLMISLDPVWPITAVGHVERYVNYYNSYGSHSVRRGDQFKGSVQNVDVGDTPGMGHLNLDTNAVVQGKVVNEIRAALQTDHHTASSPREVAPSADRQAEKTSLPGS